MSRDNLINRLIVVCGAFLIVMIFLNISLRVKQMQGLRMDNGNAQFKSTSQLPASRHHTPRPATVRTNALPIVRHGSSACSYVDLNALSSPTWFDLATVGTTLTEKFRQRSCKIAEHGREKVFVGCLDVPKKSALRVQLVHDTFDSRHSLRLVDPCGGGHEIQCVQDPDNAVTTFLNHRGESVRACVFVAEEQSQVLCHDTNGADCIHQFMLNWTIGQSERSGCEMEEYDNTNAIYGTMATPGLADRYNTKSLCVLACKTDPECALAVWHGLSLGAWARVCVQLSATEMTGKGLDGAPREWQGQEDVFTAKKRCRG